METRARMLLAGAALVKGLPSWDWRDLTFRAVAERAGVSERTVFRYFRTERELHRAVMRQLEVEAGVDYGGLTLVNLADMTGRMFAALDSFAVSSASLVEAPDLGPTFVEEDQRRRQALLDALRPLTDTWSQPERDQVAAVLDILWSLPSYERLLGSWHLAEGAATATIQWALGLVVDAIEAGSRPAAPGQATRQVG